MIRGLKKVCKQATNKFKFMFERKTLDNYFSLNNPHHHDQLVETNTINRDTKYWIQLTLYYALEYLIPFLCLTLIFSVLFAGIPTYSVPYFRLDDPALSYPIIYDSSGGMHDNLPLWFVAVVLVFAIPVCTFVVFHLLFVRNIPDFHHALLGYIQTIALTMAMVAFGWLSYGSYRPTFLQECQPDLSKIDSAITTKSALQKFVNIVKYYKPYQICKDPSRFTLGSPSQTPGFPSGHVASVMSVWVFFLLYYASKVNTWNRRRGQFFKVVLFFLIFLVPVWVGITRIVTLRHTVAQVIVGALIGIVSALLVYRYKYCSLFGIDAKTPNYYLWHRLYPQKNPQVSLHPNTIP